jgi:DNA-directed RNA polymerase subunit H (RpoH/RPB5)
MKNVITLIYIFVFIIMDSISTPITPKSIYLNVLRMLVYRRWLSKDLFEKYLSDLDKINFGSAFHQITINLHDEIRTVKVLIHINDIDFDTSKLDTITGKEDNNHLIIVYSTTTGTTKYVNMDEKKYWIETFPLELMIHPIHNHKWVGKHEIVQDKNNLIFAEGQLLDKNCFPTIYMQDPQIKYLHGKIGDIIRITTADQTKYKRVV